MSQMAVQRIRAMDGESLDEAVYQAILDLLRDPNWAQAHDINDSALARQLGVSRTPVRTALQRLETEHMVRKVKGRGWSLVPITVQDIEEIFEIRQMIDPQTARKAAENIDAEQAAELLRIMDEMERAAEARDIAAWLEGDARYDEILFTVARNERIKELARRIENQWYRFKVCYLVLDWMAISSKEHRLITDAIASKDPERAGGAMLAHNQRSKESILHVMKNLVMPFAGQEL